LFFIEKGIGSYLIKPEMKKLVSLIVWISFVLTVNAQHEVQFTDQGITESSGLVMYPNPTAEVVYIEHTRPVTEVSVFNLFGQVLANFMTTHNQNYVLDFSELKRGMYFVRITDENNHIFIQKVIKK